MLKIGNAQATAKRPIIATSITAQNVTELLAQMKLANASVADVIEWRIDYLLAKQPVDSALIRQVRQTVIKPMIFTWRTATEGGLFGFNAKMYRKLYLLAIKAGFEAIDIEAAWLFEMTPLLTAARQHRVVVIGSYHHPKRTPNDLRAHFDKLFGAPVDVVKVATFANDAADVDRLQTVSADYAAHQVKPLITMAMGSVGQRSRLEGLRYGSELTFGALVNVSAPGQLALADLAKHFSTH